MVLLQACDYGILYEKPQPDGSRNLETFPDFLVGKYYNDSAKVTVAITLNRIIKISEYDISASVAEIDTMNDCKLTGDSLFLKEMDKSVFVNIRNDSVFGILAQPDTLFTISKITIFLI
jgi:hypothetical protein